MTTKRVKYVGSVKFFDGEYNVENTIHNGEPIGNGETNNSGANIYVCIADGAKTRWLFRENEVEFI